MTAIDLHTHTTASDGLLAPAALLECACAQRLDTIAITDHDSVAGVREALACARGGALEVIAGIEVSSYIGPRELHVLGYFIDPEAEILHAFEDERSALRMRRLRLMVEQLRAAGMDLTLDDVHAQPGGYHAPGRAHVARALIAKGHAASMRDCFKRLLGPGGPGYVPFDKPEAAEAAALIERAGGVPVIAHAALDDLDPVLDELVAKGMRGIEVYHPDHGPEVRARYAGYAREKRLLVTGGSDFHGEGRKNGGALGATRCPAKCLAALRRAAGRALR